MMYIATYILDIGALFYLLGILYTSSDLNVYRKKPFLIGVMLTIIVILAEAGTIYTNNGSLSLRSINIFCNILGFILTPIIPIIVARIFDRRIIKKYKFIFFPILINTIATLLSPLYGFIFYVNLNNQYVRGNYFFIFITSYIISLMFLITSTLDIGNKYNYPIRKRMIILGVFTIIGTSIQLIYPQAYSSWHGVTLTFFLYFILMSEFDRSFDQLTGLYNRSSFEKASKEIIDQRKFSLFIIDINDFKSINDTYGHAYGDKVIKSVAQIIRKSFSEDYKCYRFAGDEFTIIGREVDSEKIEDQISNMIYALSKTREEGNLLPSVSYGYSIYKGDEKLDFNKKLKEADSQMYIYKKIHKTKY